MDDFFNNHPELDPIQDKPVGEPNPVQPPVQPTQPVQPPVQPTQPAYVPPVQPARPVQPVQQPIQPPVRPVQPPVGNQYQPQPAVNPTGDNPNKKKKNKTILTIVIIAVICIGVAIAGIIGAGVLYKADTNSSSSSSSKVDEKTEDEGEDDVDLDEIGDVDVDIKDDSSASMTDANGNLTVAGVVDKAIDSCVLVSVYSNQSSYDYFNSYGTGDMSGSDPTLAGEGSGVIMSESNGKSYIMTCAHVIDGGDSYKITLNDGTVLDAEMVNLDSQTDVGVLSVKKTGLKVASFANSKQIQVGEQCIAIGCPGGSKFVNSVTSGYVSALDRPVESSIGYNTECIQTDAAINPGNSGGALFNMQGLVIGINSSKIASTEYEGMGFAIPSNTAVKIATSLIKNGYVAGRAKIGIEYAPITNFSNASSIILSLADKGYKDANGTIVVQTIDPKSSLAKEDVKQYDMIVAVDGKTLTSTDILTSALSAKDPGDTVELTFARIEGRSTIKTFKIKCKLIESKE